MSKKKKNLVKAMPAGRAKYPRITRPDTKFKDEGEYKVDVIYDAETAAPIIEYLEEKLGDFKASLKEDKKRVFKEAELPVREEYDNEGNATGNYFLRAKQKAEIRNKDGDVFHPKVAVYDAQKNIVADPDSLRIGGGTLLKPIVEFVPFNTPTTGCGFSFRLKGVQIIELVQYGGGDDFSDMLEEEDGFVASNNDMDSAEFEDSEDLEDETDSNSSDF